MVTAVGGCSNVTETGLRTIAAHCPKLLSLDLGGCRHLVTDPALLELASSCPLLRSLNLRFCEQLSDDAVNAVYRHCLNVQVRR